MRRNQTTTWTILSLAALGGLGYLLYRRYTQSTHLAPHIKSNLPLAKKLKTVTDNEANYDIDGVSFDTNGVIISGDDNKPERPDLSKPIH